MADTTIIKLTETTAPTKDDLAIIVDTPTSKPSNKKVTLENLGSKFYSSTIQITEDDEDVSLKQYDGVEVARVHDGGTLTLTSEFTDATCDTNHTSGTGTTFGSNPKVIKMDSTSAVKAGANVSGTGIATGTTVAAVTNSTHLLLSTATTASNDNQTLTFNNGYWTMNGGSGKGGFGIRRPYYEITASGEAGDDQKIYLSLNHSGAIIGIEGGASDLDLILPAIPSGCEGWHADIAITTAFSGTNNLEIQTNGTSGDAIYMYMNTAGTSGVDVDGGDVITFVNDIAVGTLCRLTCIKGGSAEKWIAEILQPSGTAATTGTAVG